MSKFIKIKDELLIDDKIPIRMFKMAINGGRFSWKLMDNISKKPFESDTVYLLQARMSFQTLHTYMCYLRKNQLYGIRVDKMIVYRHTSKRLEQLSYNCIKLGPKTSIEVDLL